MQQLFQRSGSCWRDAGNRRKLGGVSTQQAMHATKARAVLHAR